MTKHTAGPWVVHEGDEIDVRSANPADLAQAPIYYCIAENIGGHVYGENFDDYSEVEANARLIAAAPDLLEALELLSQSAPAASCDMFHHEKQDRHTFIEECPALTRYELACLKARAAIAKARGEE